MIIRFETKRASLTLNEESINSGLRNKYWPIHLYMILKRALVGISAFHHDDLIILFLQWIC